MTRCPSRKVAGYRRQRTQKPPEDKGKLIEANPASEDSRPLTTSRRVRP
jgi:hypothetical protein